MMRLKEKYQKEVIPAMMKKFGYRNKMAVPRFEKVVVNAGFGRQVVEKNPAERKKFLETMLEQLSLITGQRPILTKAKKSIAGFKIKKGTPVGAMVTLRGQRMWDFLERLINIVLPRSRDFKGIPERSINLGNLTIGIRESIAFPEISPEKTKGIFGLEVSVVTNASKREEAVELFRLTGFPIKF